MQLLNSPYFWQQINSLYWPLWDSGLLVNQKEEHSPCNGTLIVDINFNLNQVSIDNATEIS